MTDEPNKNVVKIFELGFIAYVETTGQEVSVKLPKDIDISNIQDSVLFFTELLMDSHLTLVADIKVKKKLITINSFYISTYTKAGNMGAKCEINFQKITCPYCNQQQLPLPYPDVQKLLFNADNNRPISCKECGKGFYMDIDRDGVFHTIANCEIEVPGGRHEWESCQVDGYAEPIEICIKCHTTKPFAMRSDDDGSKNANIINKLRLVKKDP